MVEGDVFAVWDDIVKTLKDEDPSVVVLQCHDLSRSEIDGSGQLKPNTRFGIIIPSGLTTDLRERIEGNITYQLG